MSENLLEATGVQKHFPITKGLFKRQVGAVRAVDGIDLEVRSGETLEQEVRRLRRENATLRQEAAFAKKAAAFFARESR